MAYPDYVVIFRGRRACPCLKEWLPVFEKELLRRKVIKKNIDIAQLIGGAAASGGTHARGGAFDIWQRDKVTIEVARNMGAPATWTRTPAQGFSYHAHGVLRGCIHNGPARYQVTEVDNGGDGLRGNRPDDGKPRPPSKRTWKEGIAWAKAQANPPAPPKPPVITPESLVYIVTADPFLWGLVKPGSGNERKTQRPEGTRFTSKASARFENGDRWVQGTDGWWSHAGYLVPTTSIPDPVARVADVKFSTGNVNAGFDGASYARRVPGIVTVHAKAGASVRFIQEADTATDATKLCKAMGSQFRYTREQGRDSRLASSIIWDANKHQLLDSGRFDISTSSHDNLTWGLFKNIDTGVVWFCGSTILWPFPIGPNNTASDDKVRRDAIDSACRQARAYCNQSETKHKKKHIPIILGGDLNHDKDDKPDAPGDAGAKYNLIDSDIACKNRVNGDKATHAKAGGLYVGGRIDRFLLDKRGVDCYRQETIWTYPSMDHNIVVISTRLSNE